MDVTPSELKEWYETLPITEVLKRLNATSPSTLYRLLKEAGIPLKGQPSRIVRLVK